MSCIVYVALGSNLVSPAGGPVATIRSALTYLEKDGATIEAVSAFYNTPAFPENSGPDYVNAVIVLRANWSLPQTLDRLHQIEAQMGREREVRWGQRTLDLDLIGCGDVVLPDASTHAEWRNLPLDAQMRRSPDQLILPHPRVQDRAFVLVPLADVAPDWVHPVLGLSVREMLAALPQTQRAEVRAIEDTT